MLTRMPRALSLLSIGWYFALCIVGGIAGGLLLDNVLDTKPILALVGLFFGLGLAFWGGYKLLMQVISATAAESKSDEA
jgi:F0F1-type ATP synthase assembly protein I